MRRYGLFAGKYSQQYIVGFETFFGDFMSEEAAHNRLEILNNTFGNFHWYQIVDFETGEIINESLD